MKILPLVVALAAAATCAHAEPAISPARLSQEIQVLASDAFEGRGTASAAEPKVIDYIAGQLAQAGVQPGGDRGPDGARGWTQAVPLARFQIVGPVAVGVAAGGTTTPLAQGEQIAVRAAQDLGVGRRADADAHDRQFRMLAAP